MCPLGSQTRLRSLTSVFVDQPTTWLAQACAAAASERAKQRANQLEHSDARTNVPLEDHSRRKCALSCVRAHFVSLLASASVWRGENLTNQLRAVRVA